MTLNSSPLTIVPSPGVGKSIEVSTFAMKMVFNSVAYATNTKLYLQTDTASMNQAQMNPSELASSSTTFVTVSSVVSGFGENIVENKDLFVTVPNGVQQQVIVI